MQKPTEKPLKDIYIMHKTNETKTSCQCHNNSNKHPSTEGVQGPLSVLWTPVYCGPQTLLALQVQKGLGSRLVLLVVFSGTSPSAKVENSSSVANLNHEDLGWTEGEEWLLELAVAGGE